MFPFTDAVSDYRRSLDIASAVSKVEFTHDGVQYTREIFASHPAQAIVIRLTASQPGKISFKANFGSLLPHDVKAGERCLIMTGRAPAHTQPSWVKSTPTFDNTPDGKGMRFESRLLAKPEGGITHVSADGIVAENCNAVTLLLVAATSFNGPNKSPSREGKDPARCCEEALMPLAEISYTSLRAAHVADFQGLFNRVKLNLGRSESANLPTDERLKSSASDPALAALFAQFGRYLLISCSRPGDQPSNLQGLWNHQIRPPWSGNFTLNCNFQINYWAAESGNLAECHEPMLDFIRQLSTNSQRIARDLYGACGWVAHHNADVWARGGPTKGLGGEGIFQAGSAWLCQHLWEKFAFSGNLKDLHDAWPIMKGAAEFYLDTLVEDPVTHHLVTCPDISFEQKYRRPDGQVGELCAGPTASMMIIRQLFENCIAASRLLKSDTNFRSDLETTLKRLPPVMVSPSTGELQQWQQDWKCQPAVTMQHLVMWGAVCSAQITPRGTPEFAAALRKGFDAARRQTKGSWMTVFPTHVYARLHDGDAAHAILAKQLQTTVQIGIHQSTLPASFSLIWQAHLDSSIQNPIPEILNFSLVVLPRTGKTRNLGTYSSVRLRSASKNFSFSEPTASD